MPQHEVVTRFAPSPTGRLHVGNARTALFSWLLARRAGGRFLLRIEDTDRGRSDAGHEAALMEDLRWLGLDWDEGPDVGGPHGPYRQSARGALYEEAFARLLAAGAAYPCFCAEEKLAAARARARAAGRPPRYPGTCAALSAREAGRRLAAGEPAALRLRVPAGREIVWQDLVRGRQAVRSDALGDFVIRRADGTPAFLFANAVDDALMGVTHVLRGEDHVANTPRQLLLLERLGLVPPRYGHLPLLVGADGRPLAKRRGDAAVAALREAGYLPGAVRNLLARLGHRGREAGWLEPEAMAAGFDPARIGRAPARYDAQALAHWQREALARLGDEALWAWMGTGAPALAARVPPGRGAAFAAAVRDNVLLPREALVWAERLWGEGAPEPEAVAALQGAGAAFLEAALAAADAPDLRQAAARIAAATGRRGRALYLPLRAALTGTTSGPELGALWALLGPEGRRRRLRQALDRIREETL
nr:glutamate--tRNA ligase [Inmirania thermothiophila]